MSTLNHIADFVRKNGTRTNTAKSCWGADCWELGNLITTVEDDGYTTGLFSLEVEARQTADYDIEFYKGGEKELEELWESTYGDV